MWTMIRLHHTIGMCLIEIKVLMVKFKGERALFNVVFAMETLTA